MACAKKGGMKKTSVKVPTKGSNVSGGPGAPPKKKAK